MYVKKLIENDTFLDLTIKTEPNGATILGEVKKLMDINNMPRPELAKSEKYVGKLFPSDKELKLKTIAQFQEIFGVKFIASFKNWQLNKNH